MIRQAAELQNNSAGKTKTTDKNDGNTYENHNHEMELDGHEIPQNCDQMQTEDLTINQSDHSSLLQETILYGTELSAEFRDDPRKEVKKALEDAFALMAYQQPLNANGVAYLLDPSGRVSVAEELNSAILRKWIPLKNLSVQNKTYSLLIRSDSLGKSSSSTLETLYQQTTILLEDLLREDGGSAAAFLNINDYSIPRIGIESWH